MLIMLVIILTMFELTSSGMVLVTDDTLRSDLD